MKSIFLVTLLAMSALSNVQAFAQVSDNYKKVDKLFKNGQKIEIGSLLKKVSVGRCFNPEVSFGKGIALTIVPNSLKYNGPIDNHGKGYSGLVAMTDRFFELHEANRFDQMSYNDFLSLNEHISLPVDKKKDSLGLKFKEVNLNLRMNGKYVVGEMYVEGEDDSREVCYLYIKNS